jgi:hypothetical protein
MLSELSFRSSLKNRSNFAAINQQGVCNGVRLIGPGLVWVAVNLQWHTAPMAVTGCHDYPKHSAMPARLPFIAG